MENTGDYVENIKGGEKKVREFYAKYIKYFARKFDIPLQDFPALVISPIRGAFYFQDSNTIQIGTKNSFSEIGGAVGEELGGHYLQSKLSGNVGEHLGNKHRRVGEFFGFLGRRVLYDAVDEDEKEIFFPKKRLSFESVYSKSYPNLHAELKEDSVEYNHLRKEVKNRIKEAAKKGDKELRIVQKQIQKEDKQNGVAGYWDMREHALGYHNASELDLNKAIKEFGSLKNIYSLSNSEVIRKIFSSDKLKNKSPYKKNLEGRLALGFIISLAALFLVSPNNLTGNVIGTNSMPFLKPVSFAMLGISIFFGILFLYINFNDFMWNRSIRMGERLEDKLEKDPGKSEYYQGRPVIRRDTPINGGVYLGASPREAIVVDSEKDPMIQRLWHDALKLYKKYLPSQGDSLAALQATFESVKNNMPCSEKGVSEIVRKNNAEQDRKMYLGHFINTDAVCRHVGLGCGVLLEQFKKIGALAGDISIDRNEGPRGAHVWCRYTPNKKNLSPIILDVAQNIYASLSEIEKARKKYPSIWDYRRPGEE